MRKRIKRRVARSLILLTVKLINNNEMKLAIDLGGTNIRIGQVVDGVIVARRAIAYPAKDSYNEVMLQLGTLIDSMMTTGGRWNRNRCALGSRFETRYCIQCNQHSLMERGASERNSGTKALRSCIGE